ncbi:MAG TPA: peptidylprolyl isomerase [Steroidobacteraceae bacterium]|nr:peptidylprolyl isomerase [Steroidobacteraceae bacterium]
MKISRVLPLATLALLAACNKPTLPQDSSKPGDKPVATVNGTPISRDMYDFYVRNTAGKSQAELSADQRSQLLENLVRGEVIAQEATKDNLDTSGDAAAMLQLSRLQILQQAAARHYLDERKPTDAELHAEYDAQVANSAKTQYHARHILVPTQEAAQKLIDQLKKGAKFDELAKKNSTDSSKDQGGDLGWFSPSSMVPPFAKAVEGLKKGEYTQTPVQTQYGWHVIELLDTRDTPIPPFDQVKDKVAQLVEQKKFLAHEEELMKTAKIERSLGDAAPAAGAGSASAPAGGSESGSPPAAAPAAAAPAAPAAAQKPSGN